MPLNRIIRITDRRDHAGTIASVIAACALFVAPSAGAANKAPAPPPVITMALWQDGHAIAQAGEEPVTLAPAREGDEIRLAVMVGGAPTFRSFEVHLFYDAAGLEYTGWEPDKSLSTALSMPPANLPDQNRVVFVAALPRPLTLDPAAPFHVGDATFVVHDPAHLRAGIIYMEILDEAMASIKRGTKPVVAKIEPEKRRLGDDIWWTLAKPNPFAYVTSISFSTPDSMFVTMNVIDKGGKLIRPLVADTYRGKYTTSWVGTAFSGERVKNGEYIVTFEAGGKADSQLVKMVDPAELVPGHQ